MLTYGFVINLPELPETEDVALKMMGMAVTKAINEMFIRIKDEQLQGPFRIEAAFSGPTKAADANQWAPPRLMIRLDAQGKGGIILLEN